MSLLNKRLEQYKLPPWPYQPAFDRIVVYKLPEDKATRDTYAKGGKIVMPETVKKREKETTPRAILLAAGVGAMDYLRSQGIELGHIVWVARLSPWQHTVDRTAEGDVELMFLRAGDVVGSEDVLELMKAGKVKVKVGEDGKHHYVVDDDVIPRFDPPDYMDM